MITGDEIDIAAKKRLLGRCRAVAKFEADLEPVLLPNSRSVHQLPDRQMRMGAIESANVHGLILGHTLSLHTFPARIVLILAFSRWEKECLVHLFLSAFLCSCVFASCPSHLCGESSVRSTSKSPARVSVLAQDRENRSPDTHVRGPACHQAAH